MTDEGAGLLDTSVVIALPRMDRSALPASLLISAVTLAELSVGPLVARSAAVRAARQAHLQEIERTFEPLPFDGAAARAYGAVSAALRRHERKAAARSCDALIAATAIAHDLALYTLNPRDFAGIKRLRVAGIGAGSN